MTPEMSYPALYAEITCLTTPHPARKYTVETPRIIPTNTPFPVHGSYYGSPIEDHQRFPVIREIELLFGYDKYDIRRSSENRYFISFIGKSFEDDDKFLQYAVDEMKWANQVLGTVVPHAARITVDNAVYEAISGTEMNLRRPASEIGTSVPVAVVEEVDVVAQWNAFMEKVIGNKEASVFRLLDRQKDDPTLAKLIGLVSEDTFSSFYNVFEILKDYYGSRERFLAVTGISRNELSLFTGNAQVFRHANWQLQQRKMSLPEAKLFAIRMLKFYIENPKKSY